MAIELVILDESREAIRLETIPDVPDEGAILEQLAVLLEEPLAEPAVERPSLAACGLQQLGLLVGRPFVAKCVGEDALQANRCRLFPAHCRYAHDTIVVDEATYIIDLLLGPVVAQQSRNCRLKRTRRHGDRTIKDPLCWIV